MTEKRDQVIGVRFTKKERKIIENFAEFRNNTLTEFIRESVFSHMNNLKDNVGNLNVDEFVNNFKSIEKSAQIVLKSVKKLKKRLNVYDLERLNFNISKPNNTPEKYQ